MSAYTMYNNSVPCILHILFLTQPSWITLIWPIVLTLSTIDDKLFTLLNIFHFLFWTLCHIDRCLWVAGVNLCVSLCIASQRYLSNSSYYITAFDMQQQHVLNMCNMILYVFGTSFCVLCYFSNGCCVAFERKKSTMLWEISQFLNAKRFV